MDNRQVRLFRKNQVGMGTWRIWYEIHDEARATLYYAHATVMGGSEIFHKDHVSRNQSGRSILEQTMLEMKSRISRQLDKGYKPTREEAAQGSTNQMGLINPMLAHPLERVGVPSNWKNAYIQRKYDGHRCLITNFDDDVLAYTRKGKPILTIGHVLSKIGSWLPSGVTLDGELYIHGKALQSISSIIKRVQPDNVKLRFHWYDMVDRANPNQTYSQRLRRMIEMVGEADVQDTFEIVPTYPVGSLEEAMGYFRKFRTEKYEGAILRLDTHGYQDGVRSRSLIKLKEWQDCEATVVAVRPSKEGWAICQCRLDNGKLFDTSAPGSVPEKTHVLEHPELYIGRRLTIEYASLTDDGLPFHASALRWHEEL